MLALQSVTGGELKDHVKMQRHFAIEVDELCMCVDLYYQNQHCVERMRFRNQTIPKLI